MYSTGDRPEITPDARVLLFRIVQESLQNVVKHAKAAAVTIRLHYTPQSMTLEISDDGIGFDAGHPGLSSSLGMSSIQQRAAMLRSRVEVISAVGKGTTIRMTIPLTNNLCQPHPHHLQQETLQFA
jgi:signal transduction histidine kinase